MYFSENHSSFFITSDGEQIFFSKNFDIVDSKMPVLVFNYGLVCSIEHWKYQLPYFDKIGYPILVHDYRGHYNSTLHSGLEGVTFENFANDLKQLLDHLGIRKSIHIGHSMGVNTTLEFAHRFPKKISAMILISGAVVPPQDVMFDSNIIDVISPQVKFLARKFPNLYRELWKHGHLNPVLRYLIRKGGFNPKRTSDEFVEIYLKRMGELPNEFFFHLLDEMKSHQIINHLEKIKAPALIIGGDKDKIIPNYLQQMLQDLLPNSELYIVKNGSHVPQVDFPDFINERIETYLNKLGFCI